RAHTDEDHGSPFSCRRAPGKRARGHTLGKRRIPGQTSVLPGQALRALASPQAAGCNEQSAVRPAMHMTDAPFVPHCPNLLAFYALWRAKCRGDALPARADFTVDDLRPFIGRIAILDVIDGGQDFRFRLYGTQIAEEYQGEMTGKSVGAF